MKKKWINNLFLKNWRPFIFYPLILIISINFFTYFANYWKTDSISLEWDSLVIISILLLILYVVVPFSTKAGAWSLVWALILSSLTITLFILLIVVESLRLYNPIFFLYLLPLLVMLYGTIAWAINYR